MAARQQGFSLLEMIAAITLLALALSALLALAGRSLQLQQQAARQIRLARTARTLLDTAFAGGPPQSGTTQGILDGYHWQLRTGVQVSRADGGLDLYRLDLDLTRTSARQPLHQHFHTVRISPVPLAQVPP